MGAAMEEARRLLYEKAIKKFTMQEVTHHKKFTNYNLVSLLTRFPGNGQGFKVYQKYWPQGTYFHSSRYGRMTGVKYVDDKVAGGKVERIVGILKKGLWNYQLNDPRFTKPEVTLDNGLTVNLVEMQERIDEKKAFLTERKKMIEWIKPPETKVKDTKGKKGLKAKAPPAKKK
ncbi:UNKNOWN [Stylonychia lemnae]|uniref:Uncharacterized protein n=1 Tax=Stylonychia lemnae TaxID=5949 RepID=A0A077ZSL8_STYLE|nr:UNKNOWN [Stylonychia lemnae]|eukprot:CDW71476.1 UNKNOWN [Stylonychia lemnae]